jgi:hypothetical protein
MINSIERFSPEGTIYYNESAYTDNFRISIQASTLHESKPKENYQTNEPYTHFEVLIETNDEQPVTLKQAFPKYKYAKLWERHYANETYNQVPRSLIESLLKSQLPKENHV